MRVSKRVRVAYADMKSLQRFWVQLKYFQVSKLSTTKCSGFHVEQKLLFIARTPKPAFTRGFLVFDGGNLGDIGGVLSL